MKAAFALASTLGDETQKPRAGKTTGGKKKQKKGKMSKRGAKKGSKVAEPQQQDTIDLDEWIAFLNMSVHTRSFCSLQSFEGTFL